MDSPKDLRTKKRNRENPIKSIMNKRKTVTIENLILQPMWMNAKVTNDDMKNSQITNKLPTT